MPYVMNFGLFLQLHSVNWHTILKCFELQCENQCQHGISQNTTCKTEIKVDSEDMFDCFCSGKKTTTLLRENNNSCSAVWVMSHES